MPDVLSAADIATSLFVDVPEMESNSANKFFDALASGTPIAINYGGWQASILARSGAGFTLSTSPSIGASRLTRHLSDKQEIYRLSQAAARLARTEFERESLVKNLETVLMTNANLKVPQDADLHNQVSANATPIR
jgi:hypothetical protein